MGEAGDLQGPQGIRLRPRALAGRGLSFGVGCGAHAHSSMPADTQRVKESPGGEAGAFQGDVHEENYLGIKVP